MMYLFLPAACAPPAARPDTGAAIHLNLVAFLLLLINKIKIFGGNETTLITARVWAAMEQEEGRRRQGWITRKLATPDETEMRRR